MAALAGRVVRAAAALPGAVLRAAAEQQVAQLDQWAAPMAAAECRVVARLAAVVQRAAQAAFLRPPARAQVVADRAVRKAAALEVAVVR